MGGVESVERGRIASGSTDILRQGISTSATIWRSTRPGPSRPISLALSSFSLCMLLTDLVQMSPSAMFYRLQNGLLAKGDIVRTQTTSIRYRGNA